MIISRPGRIQELRYNTDVIYSYIHYVTLSFPLLALWRRHTKSIENLDFSHKMDYVEQVEVNLNSERHLNLNIRDFKCLR